MALALPVQGGTAAPLASPLLRPRAPGRRAAVRTPRLSVIIVNYCLWEETAELVRQLLAAPCTRRGDVEVVVVDNHSPPHPLLRRLRRRPEISVRRWRRNLGFAQAVNEGCRLSRAPWFLVLNPDITVSNPFLEGVLALTERLSLGEPRTGIVGFQLRNSDGSRQLSTGPFPTLPETLARLLLPRKRRKYNDVRTRRRRRVPWVTGCCMLLRRSCVEHLGGLDRNFFLYYEDVDLCRRARVHGWAVCYEPTLKVVHHHPLHLRPVPAYLRVLTRHALLTYAGKHWPTWQVRLLAGLVKVEAWVRRSWASRKGDATAVRLFGQLRAIATALGRGRTLAARQHLREVVRSEERRRAS
jgi:GT2 family glycosyltransferase